LKVFVMKRVFLKSAENTVFHKLSITNGVIGFLKVPRKVWEMARGPKLSNSKERLKSLRRSLVNKPSSLKH